MDLLFGDTAAHEEKKRIVRIEAQLRGAAISDEVTKEDVEHNESAE
jgi:hypothetical protein